MIKWKKVNEKKGTDIWLRIYVPESNPLHLRIIEIKRAIRLASGCRWCAEKVELHRGLEAVDSFYNLAEAKAKAERIMMNE